MTEIDTLDERLHEALTDYLDENETRYETVEHEYETGDGTVDLYIEDRGGRTAVAVIDPLEDGTLDRDAIKRARDGALAVGSSLFAMVTGDLLFLFDYDNQIKIVTIDCYQYDLHECEAAEDIVPILLAAIHAQQEEYGMTPMDRKDLEQYVES